MNAIPLGRRHDSEEESEARVWILHSDAAKVIGRGGRALREIENRTRTRIKVSREEDMNPDTKERSVDILGSRRGQDTAVDYILDVVLYCRQDGGRVLKDSRTAPLREDEGTKGSHRILTVLAEEVGKVLGRKGETVRIIEKESGAKVELDKAQGKVEIFGSAQEQEKAVELLLAEVHWAQSEDGTVLKDEPRPKQRSGDEPELPAPVQLFVKDREAGRVIGRGGETVREVMEKSGADIKVQKSDEMAAGSKERLIKIIGTKDQQDEAVRLILNEVSWAKGGGDQGGLRLLKGVEAEEAKPATKASEEKEKEENEKEKEELKEEKEKVVPAVKVKPRRFRETARELNRPKSGPARWVCATCGGDHRTKECPHATGILGVGVQLGMQMGLQAMGLPTPSSQGPGMGPAGFGPMPPHPGMPHPGMPPMPMMGPMGPAGMMPMGGPPPGLPGMPGMPGMPLLPGMRPPGFRSDRSESSSRQNASSSSSDGSDSENEDEEEVPRAGSPVRAAPERPRRRVRKRKVLAGAGNLRGGGAPPHPAALAAAPAVPGPPSLNGGPPLEHRRRRRRKRLEGEPDLPAPEQEAPAPGRRRRVEGRPVGEAVVQVYPSGKKKIVMSDL